MGTPILITDLSLCTPEAALSNQRNPGCWKVLPYATPGFSGKCLWALNRTGAAELTLPLNARGWHAIYLGLGGSGTEEGNAVRVKLSGDAAYQHRGHAHGACEEVLFKHADVTGQNLHFAQQSSGYPLAARLYYVKLMPLTDSEVDTLRGDASGRSGSRRLIGTIDGFSFLYERRPVTREELLEEFEPFRGTDFGTLWWCISGADQVNYRSRLGTIDGQHTGDFPRPGDRYFIEAVRTLIERGVDITRVAVDACRDMGIRIHVGLRPAAWKGPPPYEEYFTSDFYDAHPEWRCRDRDGTSVTRMSFAVPEVRQHLLDVFREVLQAQPDGLNVLYNRGVPLVLWEDAFCRLFRDRYGEDARKVPEDDDRIYDLRGEILTQWMREIRRLLDDVQKERNLPRRLELSAMTLETEEDNRRYGLDVGRWAREGLVDQLGIFPMAAHTSGKPIDLAYYRRISAGSRVLLYPGMVAWKLPEAGEVLKQVANWYDGGADGILFWDPSAKVRDGVMWPRMTRMGHREEARTLSGGAKPEAVTVEIQRLGDEPGCRWSAWAGF